MNALIDFSVRRPVAIAMMYCALALMAYAAWINLPVDVVPTGEFPQVVVSTTWSGASPESIQTEITSPIESVAITIPGVHKVSSVSRRGASQVTIEFNEDANIGLARFELSDRLSLLQPDLPVEAEAPQVSNDLPYEFAEFGNSTFFEFSLRAPRTLNELRQLAKDEIAGELAAVNGASEVNVIGGQDPHLRVTLDKERLDLYGITTQQVQQAIAALNETIPVGSVEIGDVAYSLRIEHTVEDLAPLYDLPLRKVADNLVLLRDVGSVTYAHAEAEQFRRVDGEPLVTVMVSRQPGTDVLSVAHETRATLARLAATLPSDLTFEVQTDEAADLEAELDLVARRLIVVLVLVGVLLIVLLRDLKSAPLLFMSIGASLAITIILLYHLEVPVNVLTLTGLALAFGMLVDNAVVVLENIIHYRETGMSTQDAARRGTREVVLPVLAATMTTVGVFFPFVYFQGRMRDFYAPLALGITFALTASLFVSLTLMPAAAGRGWIASRVRQRGARLPRFRRGLTFALRHPYVWLLLAGLAWYGAYGLFDEHVPRGDFGGWWGTREELIVSVTLQSGAEASRTEAALLPFEEYVLGLPNIERIETSVNQNRGNLTVKFPAQFEATAYPLVVKEELIGIATRYAGLRIGVYGFDQNGYSSGFSGSGFFSSRIKLLGYNYEQLGTIGADIAKIAERSARVQESNVTAGARDLWGPQGRELVMTADRDALSAHGLTVIDLWQRMSSLIPGRPQNNTLRVGIDEWDLFMKLEDVETSTLDEILDSHVRGTSGGSVRFGDLVDVNIQAVPGSITREDQRYERYVQWEYRGSSKASQNYREAIFNSLELPAGYSASLENDWRLTDEERVQIRLVATVAIIIVFMVLASLYESLLQPFIVLLSVPAALIGVFMIFYWTGKAFDASAPIGVVLLGGIVVNNAILLVDHINLRRGELPLIEAIVAGTAERVRPILITSITTIGGMLPLVLIESTEEAARRSDIWTTLALSTVGGLTVSTLLMLTLTPMLYLLAERWRQRAGGFVGRVTRIWRALPA